MGVELKTVLAKHEVLVAVLSLAVAASAGVAPTVNYAVSPYTYPFNYGYTAAGFRYPAYAAGAYHGYAANHHVAYAAQPVAAAFAPVAGVYAGLYDASVAYSQLSPAAVPYV